MSLMGDIEEIKEQKIACFLSGLIYTIKPTVELYPYANFETLCNLCLKVDAQGKSRYGAS